MITNTSTNPTGIRRKYPQLENSPQSMLGPVCLDPGTGTDQLDASSTDDCVDVEMDDDKLTDALVVSLVVELFGFAFLK